MNIAFEALSRNLGSFDSFESKATPNAKSGFLELLKTTSQTAPAKQQVVPAQSSMESKRSDTPRNGDTQSRDAEARTDVESKSKSEVSTKETSDDQKNIENVQETDQDALLQRLAIPQIFVSEEHADAEEVEIEGAEQVIVGEDTPEDHDTSETVIVKEAFANHMEDTEIGEAETKAEFAEFSDAEDSGAIARDIPQSQELENSKPQERGEVKKADIEIREQEESPKALKDAKHDKAPEIKSAKPQAQPIANDAAKDLDVKNEANQSAKAALAEHEQEIDAQPAKAGVIESEGPKALNAKTSKQDAELSGDVESVQVQKSEARQEQGLSGQNDFDNNEGKESREKIDPANIKKSGAEVEAFSGSVSAQKSFSGGTISAPIQSFGASGREVANQIAENISNNVSSKSGNDTFTIKLNPESLGEVDVQVIASREGKIESIKLTVKEPETLRLIAESQRELMDSLKQVTDIDDASLSFNLKEGDEQGSNAKHQQSMHEFFQDEAEYNSGTKKMLAQNTPRLYNHAHNADLLHKGVSITL